MAAKESVVAIDIGASSGRCILGNWDGAALGFEEVHRFANRGIQFNGHLRWNVPSLFEEIKRGLVKCATKAKIRSIGIDTWGVDFGLLGPGRMMLELPVCYRDNRTDGYLDRVSARISREEIYAATGIQFLPFNTLYQLCALTDKNPRLLEIAERLLLMPDLFAFLFTGEIACELTNASTTQMLNARDHRWANTLLERLRIPTRVLPDIITPGTDLGELSPEIVSEIGLDGCRFVATATHDTASAVAGVPYESGDWAYISCGTWSLVGIEAAQAITTGSALSANFTNEAGVDCVRFLKNVTGLWVVQEVQRELEKSGRSLSNDELAGCATSSRDDFPLLDVDDAGFLSPTSMRDAINEYCARTSQPSPTTVGATIGGIMHGLALKHRQVLRTLADIGDRSFDVIHMVGGGSRNTLLCQLTADASGIPVLAGPSEATALGNIAVQGIANGWFSGLREAREAISNSVKAVQYTPRMTGEWDGLEERYERVATQLKREAAV
jgi:rhamnulokinase